MTDIVWGLDGAQLGAIATGIVIFAIGISVACCYFCRCCCFHSLERQVGVEAGVTSVAPIALKSPMKSPVKRVQVIRKKPLKRKKIIRVDEGTGGTGMVKNPTFESFADISTSSDSESTGSSTAGNTEENFRRTKSSLPADFMLPSSVKTSGKRSPGASKVLVPARGGSAPKPGKQGKAEKERNSDNTSGEGGNSTGYSTVTSLNDNLEMWSTDSASSGRAGYQTDNETTDGSLNETPAEREARLNGVANSGGKYRRRVRHIRQSSEVDKHVSFTLPKSSDPPLHPTLPPNSPVPIPASSPMKPILRNGSLFVDY